MFKPFIGIAAIAAIALGPQVARAQTVDFKTIPLTFQGTVTNDPGATIRIQQLGAVVPAGQPVPTFGYTGPIPDMPVKTGTTFQISYNLTVPTGAFLTSSAYTGPRPADGIYKLQIAQSAPLVSSGSSGPLVPAPLGTYALYSGGSITAPFSENPAGSSILMGTLAYNANTDSYSLIPDAQGNLAGTLRFDGPTYTYDYDTNTLGVTASSCGPLYACTQYITGEWGFSLGANGGSSTGVIKAVTNAIAPAVGWFDVLYSGALTLGTDSSGGATQVPEPGMLGLFGMSAALLAARRRKVRAMA